MIELNLISHTELKPLIKQVWESDPEIVNYHIWPGTVAHMTDHNWYRSVEANMLGGGAYEVSMNQPTGFYRPIGFTVIIRQPENILYSFGIKKEDRTKENLIQWLQCIEKLFGGNYKVPLWAKNERAINFFLKNNFYIYSNQYNIITLTQTEASCL